MSAKKAGNDFFSLLGLGPPQPTTTSEGEGDLPSTEHQQVDAKDLSVESLRDDEPIRTFDRDLLNRDQLVEALARQIEATDTKEPIVIGLNAPWGTGKSSFLHLLSARLAFGPGGMDQSESDRNPFVAPIIIDFNPWLYGNLEQLIQIFFHQFATKIGGTNPDISGALKALGTLASTLCPAIPAGVAALTDQVADLLKQTISDRKKVIDNALVSLDRRIIVLWTISIDLSPRSRICCFGWSVYAPISRM